MAASTRARHWNRRRSLLGAVGLFALAVATLDLYVEAASAQTRVTFPGQPRTTRKGDSLLSRQQPQPTGDKQMLVRADEINYDNSNNLVLAVGNVQIFYSGSTLEANRVIYDQNTKRLRAEGNVRLTEADGKIIRTEVLDLTDDYRDGFVDSLRVETPDQTRIAANRAERSSGTYTVFQSGVYTACEACKENPQKPPLWQVKAARIIHDQGEKMIYFEDARIEFFGVPLAYVPFFSAPDPTVKRKTGFLQPIFSTNTKYGFGVETPFFWALAPDYDLTVSPIFTTKQGPLLQAEWRQRLLSGSYSIRASGIFQLDKDEFLRDAPQPPTPGYRDFRGAIESTGQFRINPQWVWGWDVAVPTDKTFFYDYNLPRYRTRVDPLRTDVAEGTSQIYLAGRGDRSYFDARAMYFYGFSEFDNQDRIPVIHPVVDYSYVFGQPVLGGEVGYKVNLTSLTRDTASFDAITQMAMNTGLCLPTSADPMARTPANCLLRGAPGTYSRLSADVYWKRQITDPFGQVFMPFFSVRADAATVSIQNQPGVSNYLPTGDDTVFRGMATAGLEYRYPFINAQSWGTQIFEPIAQVILRPNETAIGKLPNEDAQSLVFDDSNLFRVDKFSGWDRVEGGGRANVGVQYTAQVDRAGFFNVLFGQSYHLFGLNSFAVGGPTNTGLDSGLDTARSDYVARLSFQPNSTFTYTSRFRFDEQDFDIERFEVEGRANLDRWTLMLLYGNYAAQPELGFLQRRQGMLGTAQVKIAPSLVLMGGARYDLEAAKFDQTQIGLGYVDDCLILAVNYLTNYTYSGNPTADHRVMLQLSLRTISDTFVTQSVSALGSSSPGGLLP